MVEDVKELALKSQLHMLRQREPFCQVEVAPEEIGTAQGIAAEALFDGLSVLTASVQLTTFCINVVMQGLYPSDVFCLRERKRQPLNKTLQLLNPPT
jgi:hypothetical protein